MEQKEEVERWPQLKKKKRRSLSVERLRGLFSFKSSPKATAKPQGAAAAPRGRSPTRAQIRVPFDKPAAAAPAAKKPPAPAPAKPAKPAARQPPAPAAPRRRRRPPRRRAGAGADQTAAARARHCDAPDRAVRRHAAGPRPRRRPPPSRRRPSRRGPRRPCPRPRRYRFHQTAPRARAPSGSCTGTRSATPL